MEQQKENENSVAVRLKRHLGKMSAQVDYLIRNNKLLTQLDIDNLMTNTRELYDMLCSVNANMDVCSIPFEIENDNEDVNESKESRESRESDYEVEEEEVNEGENVDVEKEELSAESFELNIEEEDENVNKEEEEEVNDEDDDLIDEDDENENEDDEIDEEDEDEVGEDEDEVGEDEISDVEDLSDLTEEDVDTFIKELFRGNEDRFSRAMAELEEAPTWKAALTHLEEMSIAYGWDYDSPAYQKLVELLERRY